MSGIAYRRMNGWVRSMFDSAIDKGPPILQILQTVQFIATYSEKKSTQIVELRPQTSWTLFSPAIDL